MIQRLRLFTGLVLFTYVTTHLLNHALGMASLQIAEAARLWFTAVWRHPIGTALLYPSLVTHIALALWALYQRRHLRMPAWEILRAALGLMIPFLLIPHVFATRVAHEAAGVNDTYTRQMLFYWVINPSLGIQQIALLCIAWLHGSLGIHYWLRVKPWHALSVPVLSALGPLVPILAVFGFVNMGLEVSALMADPTWQQNVSSLPPDVSSSLERARNATMGLFITSLIAVFIARQVRAIWQRRQGVVRLSYPDGRRVEIIPGTTILEASRYARIPHASLCGGRGRCSTCRSRIGAGLESLAPPSVDEARVLRRINAPPNVRLACQVRPTANLEVFPLLPPIAATPNDLIRPGQSAGTEQEIAVLFADLRAFTQLSETRLPYDVVFLLNQYFAAVGRVVEEAGGQVDKFIGDGLMALFGLNDGPEAGCRAALEAARGMADALATLNQVLEHDLGEPLRMAIGIHTGQVIVGELGYGQARSLTAVGDAVNIASRLEASAKELESQLVVSEDVARRAGVDLSRFPRSQIEVRGRSRPLTIRAIANATEIGPALAAVSIVQAAAGAARTEESTRYPRRILAARGRIGRIREMAQGDTEKVTFESDGLKLAGVIHRPAGAGPDERLSAFLVLHGFGSNKDSGGSVTAAEQLAERGYLALRIDFRGCGESEGERGLVLCLDQVADTRNGVTYLQGRPDVDPDHIALIGASFGAAVAVYTGGIDERVAAVVSSGGWGNGERKFRRQHPTPEAWARFTSMLEEGRRRAERGERMMVPRYDIVPIPEHLRHNVRAGSHMEFPWEVPQSMYDFRADDVVGNIAPRPLLLIHPANDSVTPTQESVELFLRAGQPTELHLFSEVDHFLFQERSSRVTELLEGWLNRYFPANRLAGVS